MPLSAVVDQQIPLLLSLVYVLSVFSFSHSDRETLYDFRDGWTVSGGRFTPRGICNSMYIGNESKLSEVSAAQRGLVWLIRRLQSILNPERLMRRGDCVSLGQRATRFD